MYDMWPEAGRKREIEMLSEGGGGGGGGGLNTGSITEYVINTGNRLSS